MDGASRHSNPQSTLEEEAKRRNTDCVYFLASPLTCIKGADCEYRHSEIARINPRDCRFWLNGNCLNPKCAFRHPPLDGFCGISAAPSPIASQPSLPSAAPSMKFPPHVPGPYQPPAFSSNRQKVPCYYFQKGVCLKGDKCPFMHGSHPTGDSALSQAAKTVPASDSQPIKKIVNGIETSILQQKYPSEVTMQLVEVPPIIKVNAKTRHASTLESTAKKPNKLINGGDEFMRPTRVTMLVPSGNALSRPDAHQSYLQDDGVQDGKDAGECLGESPPGFDVLVDDEVEENECFDADMERTVVHGRKHFDSLRKFDYITDPVCEFELGSYESYGQQQDQYEWDQNRASMEQILDRPSLEERILMFGEESHDVIGQDLRHQLSKRRRASESGTIVGSNHHNDVYKRDDKLSADRYHRHSRQKLMRHYNAESSISKRLQGRIKFPRNHLPDGYSESYLDVETYRRQMRGRSSPSRSGVHQARHSDKVRGRLNEAIISEEKGCGGQTLRRSEERKVESLNFAGPKSLAEIRSAKISDTHEEQSSASVNRQLLGSQVFDGEEQKNMWLGRLLSHDSSTPLSFEGPKPLSMILKGKREMASGTSTGSKSEDEKRQTEKTAGHLEAMDLQTPMVQRPELQKESDTGAHSPVNTGNDKQKLDSRDETHLIQNDELPLLADFNVQVEDGLLLEPQGQHVGSLDENGELDDAVSEGRILMEEYPVGGDEYLDDEDGDDFARKLGVMFS